MANIKSTLAKQLANAFGKSVSPKNADKAADAIAAVRQRNTKNPVADLEDTKKIADLDTAENLIGSDDALKEWKKLNTLPESQRQSNIPEAQKAAENLYEGRITSKEARKRIKENFPEPELYTAETMPEMPSVTDTVGAMGKKAKRLGIIKVKGFDLKSGERVGARLDIPAYNQYDKWVVSIHEGNSIQGKVKGYGQAIRLKNIEFGSKPKAALDIAKGGNKATIARIFGDYIPEDPYELQQLAKKILQEENSEWTQVGMNPYRGSYFYDKVTGNPVTKADEIIQVGPLVLAKNVQGLGQKVKPALSEMKKLFGPSAARTKDGKVRIFNAGGMVKQMEMFEGGGLSDETTKSNLAAAKKMYPILEGLEYDIVETPDEEGPYALEHFSPGEKGSVKSPRPDGIPLDRYGLHVFKTTKPEDIAGDIISHRLVNDDPYLSKKYKEFKEATSPEVMERRYEIHQKNLGEERAYDLWAETTGFPELLRGHVFNQFPEEAKDSLYTDEQKRILEDIKTRVTQPKEFNKGGTTMSMTKQMEMFEDGGLSDEGGTIDEMSGNDVPTGSLKEEVRDDIPAQLSEGEFVLPADVVRYHGLDKIMRLRDEAKAGIARMEAMGQMGNSEEAVLPDDVPFSLDDLEIDDDDVTTLRNGCRGKRTTTTTLWRSTTSNTYAY
jgi:hypothetical protein